jgi:hypothetical protein
MCTMLTFPGRKHVLSDFTPYICTFEHCGKAEAMFDSRSEWHTHELQFHRREWLCPSPGHGVFRNRPEFELHLRHLHSAQYSDAQLPTFLTSCERTVHADTIECPLCTEDTQILGGYDDDDEDGGGGTSADHHHHHHHHNHHAAGREPTIRRDPKKVPVRIFKRHLGRHLERLALFAISSAEDDADEEGSLPSNNLNTLASRSWIGEDVSSNSAESDADKPATSNGTGLLASAARRPVADSATTSTGGELPPELLPTPATTDIALPCRDVGPYTRNPNFVGRRETAATLQRALKPGAEGEGRTGARVFALCGSGGVGKTETARNYVFDEIESFQVVLWAHASSATQLIDSFSNFSAVLGLVAATQGKEQDPTIDADILRRWFNETGMCHVPQQAKQLLPL